MANAVGFEGANKVFHAPKGMETCRDLQVFQSSEEIISCWRFSEDELAEINRTGVVWLSVSGTVTPPVSVSGIAFFNYDNKTPRAEPYIEPKRIGGKL